MKKSHYKLKATTNELAKSQKSMSSLMEEMFTHETWFFHEM